MDSFLPDHLARQQMTKSREAYESQRMVYSHRTSTTTTLRPRPQSAGGSSRQSQVPCAGASCGVVVDSNKLCRSAAAYSLVSHRGGSCGSPRNGSSSRSGRQGQSKDSRGPPNHGQPPLDSHRELEVRAPIMAVAFGPGEMRANVRPGKPRTRVRPSSASARAGGRPGAGRGAGEDPKADDDVRVGRKCYSPDDRVSYSSLLLLKFPSCPPHSWANPRASTATTATNATIPSLEVMD